LFPVCFLSYPLSLSGIAVAGIAKGIIKRRGKWFLGTGNIFDIIFRIIMTDQRVIEILG